jgi:cysteine synthase A
MQGWSPDFVPKLAEDAVNERLFDRVVPVAGADALRLSRELATREGIFVGISAGATLAAALTLAGEADEGANILCMLPDTGERYLSTPLFAEIPVEMTPEEIEISRSTPRYRFDAPPPEPSKKEPPPEPPPVAVTPEAAAFLDQVTSDAGQPVVMFALEWCEFCWSVRRMFATFGIAYRSIDLDSVAYQENEWGAQIRAALTAKTGIRTIPQIFVAGDLLGGCTETFNAWRKGSLQQQLEKSGVAFSKEIATDPYSFLPGWLHPR